MSLFKGLILQVPKVQLRDSEEWPQWATEEVMMSATDGDQQPRNRDRSGAVQQFTKHWADISARVLLIVEPLLERHQRARQRSRHTAVSAIPLEDLPVPPYPT